MQPREKAVFQPEDEDRDGDDHESHSTHEDRDRDGHEPPSKRMRFLPTISAARSSAVSWDGDTARSHLSKPGHLYTEFLRSGDVTKIYLDYDFLLVDRPEDAPPLSEDDPEVQRHLGLVVERLDHILFCLQTAAASAGQDEARIAAMRYAVAVRHGWCRTKRCWKVSIRPFFLGVRIAYHQTPNILRITGQLPDLARGEVSFWDQSVYKPSEQLLACINGIKGPHDSRMLVPLRMPGDGGGGSVDLLDYVAQAVEESWCLLNVTPEIIERNRVLAEGADKDQASTSGSGSGSVSVSVTSMEDVIVPEGVLRHLVGGLAAARADDRKQWIETVWAIHAVSVQNGYDEAGEAIAHDLSRRHAAKYDARAVTKAYHAGRVGPGTCGIGSLLFWYKADNAAQPAMFRQVQAMLRAASATPSTPGAYAFVEDPNGALTQTAVVDPHGPLISTLKRLHPDFSRITRGAFSSTCTENGKTVRLTDPTLPEDTTWSLLSSRVRIAGVVVGDLAPDMRIQGIMPSKFSNSALFQVVCDENGDDITLTHTSDSRSTIRLSDVSGKPHGTQDLAGMASKALTGRDAKAIADTVMAQRHAHNDRSIGTSAPSSRTSAQYFNITFNQTINNNLILVGGGGKALGEPEKPKDFVLIRVQIEAAGLRDGLRKKDGTIYEPVEGCPCAYVARGTYGEFVRDTLRGDPVFNSSPRLFDDMMKWLTNYNELAIPWLTPDMDLLSFSNGVLQLATGAFTWYDGLDAKCDLAKRVARHHIPLPYTGCVDTPLLDTIFDRQFGREVAQVLCALIGRLLFKVGLRDGWQVMPFVVGVGGTGKSLLLKVVRSMFAPGAVGVLGTKREEVFGMANIADKELVMGCDMPAKMSGCLSQDNLQSMTAGEGMEIPRKGLTALHVTWTAPMIIASNHMPDYVNTGNNIGRRIVSIRFDKMVTDPREELEGLIMGQELPNIIARCLAAYDELRERVTAAKGFWKAMPPEIMEWKAVLGAATNKLEEFLTMDDEARGCSIQYEEGAITWLLDFRAVFEAPRNKIIVKFVPDASVFQAHGFQTSPARVNVCKLCKRLSVTGCCMEGGRSDKIKKDVIYCMKLEIMAAHEMYT